VNIIIVGTAYPLRGGIAHYNALLASALKARGHSVETITFKRQYPAFLFPGSSQEESGEGPYGDPAPRLVDSINPWNWWRVGRFVRRKRPDVLLFKFWIPFFGPCFGTIAAAARSAHSPRVIYVCDNVLPHERRPFDRLFTRYAFRRADAFLVQSDAVERDLLAFWPGARYRKSPHPVYDMFGPRLDRTTARAQLGMRKDERILLFFGYIRRYKGLDILLQAMRQVADRLDVRLHVVGEFYDDKGKYLSLAHRLRLDTVATFHAGYLPNDRVAAFFSAADAVVLPYLSATQSGIAQIAYHYDLPLLATDVGGLAEVVHDGVTGFVVPPADPAALAGAIVRFFEEGCADRFASGVRTEKQKYSWDALVDAVEDLAGATAPPEGEGRDVPYPR
jgi:glycosyltransferase involved in cell wall biosynthesis